MVLLRVGRADEAIAHYQERCGFSKITAEASLQFGRRALSQGDMDGAIVHYSAGAGLIA